MGRKIRNWAISKPSPSTSYTIKFYYVDSASDANQIWSVGIDGTGAVRLSEDKASPINVSGDWIYYGHPTDEMFSFEF